jgi:TPR repeat protein
MFEYGEGVAKDTAEAIRWYRLAAAQGQAEAIAALKRLGV